MENIKRYNQSLSEEDKLAILKAAKGGSWYDGWKPYHIEIPYNPKCSSPRMRQTDYGFVCPSCGGEVGWNLCKIES